MTDHTTVSTSAIPENIYATAATATDLLGLPTAKELARYVATLLEPDDLIEIRSIPVEGTDELLLWDWLRASDLSQAKLVHALASANFIGELGIYIGVNPRKDLGKKRENVELCRSLVADFDHTDILTARSTWEAAGMPAPTVTVSSGHGVHAYWRLTAPITPDEWEPLQRKLVVRLGSDPKVKDAARVMRLPGFWNTKSVPFVPCLIVEDAASRLYDIAALIAIIGDPEPVARATPAATAAACSTEPLPPEVEKALLRAANAYLKKCPPAIQGQSGDAHTFSVAGHLRSFICEGYRLDAGRIADLMSQEWNRRCEPPWTAADLLVKATSACANGTPRADKVVYVDDATTAPRPDKIVSTREPDAPQTADHVGTRPVISNVTEGRRGGFVHVPLPDIAAAVQAALGGWPRRIGGQLFIAHDPPAGELPSRDSVTWIESVNSLFAAIGRTTDIYWESDPVKGANGSPLTPVNRGELLAYLQQSVPSFEAIEALPHVPPIPSLYYLPAHLPPCPRPEDYPDGRTPLMEFVHRLNPATPEDRDLLLAAILTPAWGGPAGARPAFVLTSEFGRGTGKTTTAEAIAMIYGGYVAIPANDDQRRTRERLLSDTAATQRVAIIDNLKTSLGNAEIEGLITCATVSGHKLHVGEMQRPNHLTWVITANCPGLSCDLAERSVVIRIGARRHQENFREWAFDHVQRHRAAILAEIIAILGVVPRSEITGSNRDRWRAWQDGVLAHLPNGDALAALIIARRPEVDDDGDEAAEIGRVVEELVSCAYPADWRCRSVLIPFVILHRALLRAGVVDATLTPRGAIKKVRAHLGSRGLESLRDGRKNIAKGWCFTGPDYDGRPADKLAV